MNTHTPNPGLFPETLLVECADGQAFTTSLKVAEHFGKQHKNVLRDIERLLADCPNEAFRRLNFEPTIREVPGPKGAVRQEAMYRLTHDGFALLAMGFTGREALRWKIAFLNAFRAMETQLRAQAERESQALYVLRPHWRTIGLGLAKGQSREQIRTQTGHRSVDSITRNKARMRAAGLLDG
jgi:Rha family phage regulatory protein